MPAPSRAKMTERILYFFINTPYVILIITYLEGLERVGFSAGELLAGGVFDGGFCGGYSVERTSPVPSSRWRRRWLREPRNFMVRSR